MNQKQACFGCDTKTGLFDGLKAQLLLGFFHNPCASAEALNREVLRLQILQIGGGDVVFEVVPRKISVDLGINVGNGPFAVPDLLRRRLCAGDDRPRVRFAVLGLALNLRNRRRVVARLRVRAVYAFHTLLCHIALHPFREACSPRI